MDHKPSERRLVAPADGASYYDTSLRTFRRMIARGDVAAYRLPGSRLLRVDLNELDAILRPIPTAGDAA
jgi:hypothetical protein